MKEMMRSMRRMRIWALFALFALPSTACHFDVVNPGRITEDALSRPDAVPVIVNGFIGDVEEAFDEIVLHTALASGELKFSGTRSWLGFMGDGDMRPEDANETWPGAATAMWTTVNGIRLLTDLGATGDQIATANLYAGFAFRMAGETFCKFVFDGGEMMDRDEYFNRALTYFSAAESGSGDIGIAARAGAAQALLNLGRYSEAAAKAATVNDNDFIWVAYFNPPNDNNELWQETRSQTQASVWQTAIADLGEDGDPRAPFEIKDESTAGGDPVYYEQQKYMDQNDDMPLVNGWEMRLIEAEALLMQGTPDVSGAMAKINAVRTAFDVPTKTAANVAEAIEALKWERLVTLWLEGRRLMDLKRWEDSFLTGRDYCFPFADSEINSNVNLQGCSTGPECT